MHACIIFFHVHVGVMLFEQRKEGGILSSLYPKCICHFKILDKDISILFLLKIDIKTIHRCFLDLSIDL